MFGIGWTILECSDDVRFGMTRSSSAARLAGRDSPERGREVNEGAMFAVAVCCAAQSSAANAFAVGMCCRVRRNGIGGQKSSSSSLARNTTASTTLPADTVNCDDFVRASAHSCRPGDDETGGGSPGRSAEKQCSGSWLPPNS